MWVVVNALSIAMWLIIYLDGDSSALLIIIMKSVNLCNAAYGFWNWRKIAKQNNNSSDRNHGEQTA